MAGLKDWDICSRIWEKCHLEPTAENIEELQKLYIGLDSYFPLGVFSGRSRDRVEIAQRAVV